MASHVSDHELDSAAPPVDGLDVERLARAIHVGCTPEPRHDGPDSFDYEIAEAYASRYGVDPLREALRAELDYWQGPDSIARLRAALAREQS